MICQGDWFIYEFFKKHKRQDMICSGELVEDQMLSPSFHKNRLLGIKLRCGENADKTKMKLQH